MGLRPVIELTSMGAGKDEVPELGDLLESQRDRERKGQKSKRHAKIYLHRGFLLLFQRGLIIIITLTLLDLSVRYGALY